MPSNNPGNIRPTGQTQGFRQFDNPEQGLSAIDQNLQAYAGHGINTLADVISRWSPPNENNTEQLIANASKMLGIHPYQEIDLNNPSVRHLVSAAIVRQENPVFKQTGVVKSPTIAQKKQIEAGIDINKEQQISNIKTQAEINKTKGLSEAKRETSGANLATLLNQKFDGKTIDELIDESTGSGFGAALDTAGRYIGKPTDSSLATKKLKTIQGWLVSNVPRMEGPQSDFDVKNYQEMAGAIADPTTTREERKQAFNTIKQIVSKYSGNKTSSNNDDIDSLVNKYLGGQ